jgi:CubicO group peptidase (beta-lactamase class C family)
VRTLLAHRAGMPAVRERLPDDAPLRLGSDVRRAGRPGALVGARSAHGYHVNTYGFLAGELVRRVTRSSVGEALARIVTGPAEADFHWGLAPRDHARVAEVVTAIPVLREEVAVGARLPADRRPRARTAWCGTRTSTRPGSRGFGAVNTAEWRSAVIPSTTATATARAVASLYASFVRGGPPGAHWAGEALRSEAVAIHADGEDRVTRRPSRFGLGFQLAQPARPIGASARAFGHFGYGGSLGFADPEAGLAFAYLMNRPGERCTNPRTERLIEALYRCLEAADQAAIRRTLPASTMCRASRRSRSRRRSARTAPEIRLASVVGGGASTLCTAREIADMA